MNFLPANARDRSLLLLFPFKAYVLEAPVCYTIWELATSGHRIRGAREEATGIVSVGYAVCFLIFAMAAICFCVFQKNDAFGSPLLFACFAFCFPVFIFENAAILVATVVVCALGTRLVKDRSLFAPVAHQQNDPFACPTCGTTIPGQLQKCPHCAWTYLE